MLKIRLQRVGRKNVPTFRIVVTDSKNSTKSGKFLEVVGSYDPVNDVKSVDEARVKHWISRGAKPSGTVTNYLIDKKIVTGKKINVLPKKKPIVSESAEAPAPAAEAPKDAAAPSEPPAEAA